MIKAVIFDMYETLITLFDSPLYFGTQMAADGDFIYSGSALYRISKIENNLVKVVPTSRKMTCSLASRTYHQSQLEDLGYKIRGDLL